MTTERSSASNGKLALLAGLVGIVVFSVSLLAAWWFLASWPYIAYERVRTHGTLLTFSELIEEYHNDTGELPATLDALPAQKTKHMRTDAEGRFSDAWGSPVVYARTEEGYEVCTLGRDGRPDGAGIDGDYCIGVPSSEPGGWTRGSYAECSPTFRQFTLEMETTRGILGACVVSGLIAATVFLFVAVRKRKRTPESNGVIENIIVTVVCSLMVAAVLIFHYTPMGH